MTRSRRSARTGSGVITMGQDGAKVIYGGQRASVSAFKVDVADHTGAGDTFAASFFIGATDRSVSAIRAARFASAVSGMSLREVGMHSIPNREEVDAFMRTAEELPIKS